MAIAKKASAGAMSPASLQAWMDRLHFKKSKAADELGIARTTLDRYLEGDAPIPKVVALACAAIAQGVPPIR